VPCFFIASGLFEPSEINAFVAKLARAASWSIASLTAIFATATAVIENSSGLRN
jgi:hypothetical protein